MYIMYTTCTSSIYIYAYMYDSYIMHTCTCMYAYMYVCIYIYVCMYQLVPISGKQKLFPGKQNLENFFFETWKQNWLGGNKIDVWETI